MTHRHLAQLISLALAFAPVHALAADPSTRDEASSRGSSPGWVAISGRSAGSACG